MKINGTNEGAISGDFYKKAVNNKSSKFVWEFAFFYFTCTRKCLL